MSKKIDDAETARRVARSTAFIEWLWDLLGGDVPQRQMAMLGVLDRQHEIRLDALNDAVNVVEQVATLQPASKELALALESLREMAKEQQQVVDAVSG